MTLFGQYFSCTSSQRGCRTRLSIRWQDPNKNTDTETRCLVYLGWHRSTSPIELLAKTLYVTNLFVTKKPNERKQVSGLPFQYKAMTKHSSNYPTHACVSSAEGSEAGAAARQRRQDTTLGLNRDPSHLRRAPLLIDPLISVNRSKFKGPSFLFLVF